MTINNNIFTFSNNWWIENDKAWFVNGMYNVLFCIDLKINECELAVRIPDENPNTFRLTPFCIKCDKYIFCIPGMGKYIWIYDSEYQTFSKMDIDNPSKTQLSFNIYNWKDKIFAVPSGAFKKILEINVNQRQVENYYTICEKDNMGCSTMADSVIYSLSAESNRIYQFDLSSKTIEAHTIPQINRKLWTICYDGKELWLSGYGREIYVWNKERNTLLTIDDFPQDFGIYDFDKNSEEILDCKTEVYDVCTFGYSTAVGEYVWFIPFQTNKIIYIDKMNYKLHTFEIEEESETKESLLGRIGLRIKYILEYVKDDRYIGLFSLKNNCILEIDTKELKYQWCNFDFKDKCSRVFADSDQKMWYEGGVLDRLIYDMQVRTVNHNIYNVKSDIGEKIHKKIMGDALRKSIS